MPKTNYSVNNIIPCSPPTLLIDGEIFDYTGELSENVFSGKQQEDWVQDLPLMVAYSLVKGVVTQVE